MDDRKDYIGDFSRKISRQVTKYVLPVFITLVGAFGASLFQDYATWNILQKVGGVAVLMVGILLLFVLYFVITDVINGFIHKRTVRKQSIVFPHDITLGDIAPYTIEEEITEKKYLVNKNTSNFDVINKVTYTVKGGCSKVFFIEHTFSGFNLSSLDDLRVELHPIAGKKVIESGFIQEKNLNHCILRAAFETALLPGEEASYAIKLLYDDGLRYWSDDQSKNQVTHRKIVTLEMKKLDLSIEFPKGYRIIQPEYIVESRSNVRIKKVESLCEKDNIPFSDQVNRDPVKLELAINEPIPGLNYMITWKLTDMTTLANINFPD